MSVNTNLYILIIDPGRSEFFFDYIKLALEARGHTVTIAKQCPFDVAKYDVILKVYLDDGLAQLAANVSSIPIIGVGMGTDIVTGAAANVPFNLVDRVITFNPGHRKMLLDQKPEAYIELATWAPYEKKLRYESRKPPKKQKGKYKNVKILNIAEHMYSKGLDNLVQMLEDCDCLDLKTTELHVIGNMLDPYLSKYIEFFRTKVATYALKYYGGIHPKGIDNVIADIRPDIYVTASQGECGATTVAEAMFRGMKALVLRHPFEGEPGSNDGVYAGSPVYFYSTARELNTMLEKAFTDKTRSIDLQKHAQEKFSHDQMIDTFQNAIESVVAIRRAQGASSANI